MSKHTHYNRKLIILSSYCPVKFLNLSPLPFPNNHLYKYRNCDIIYNKTNGDNMKEITIIDNKHINLLNDSMKFLSENTQRAYKSDLHTFLSIVNKEIQKTTMKDLHYYFSELENRNYRNSTINRKINSLSKIFTIYEKAGIIKENLIRQIKEIKKITRETDKIVIQNLNKHDITEVINHASEKTALIIKTLTNTGLRISELANIKNRDIANYDGFKMSRVMTIPHIFGIWVIKNPQ